MAYALGLIGPNARRELHLIRKVRNEFGHEPKPISFDHPPIASRCRELYHHQLLPDGSPRSSFTRSVMGLLARIHGEIRRTQHRDVGKDLGTIGRRERERFQTIGARLWDDLKSIVREDLSEDEMRAAAKDLERHMEEWLRQLDS
jgi:hypothetical protein